MGALRVEKLQFSGKMSAFKQLESMRLAEEAERLKAEEEARLKAEEEKRVSDEQAAMAALFEEAEATKKLLAEAEATKAALLEEAKAAAEREHARTALLEEMEAAEKRLAEDRARRVKVMLNRQLSIAFHEWQATAAQTKAEVEVEFQEAMQKAVWPCGEVLVHDDVECNQTSGGTPPVSGKTRRWWLFLFSFIALVCFAVFMLNGDMPVMSEDSHVPDTMKADVLNLKPNVDLLVEKGIDESKVHDAEELYRHRNAATSNLNVVNQQVKVYEDEITKKEAKTALVAQKEATTALVVVNDGVANKRNRKAAKSKKERNLIDDVARHYPGGDIPEDEAKKADAKKVKTDDGNIFGFKLGCFGTAGIMALHPGGQLPALGGGGVCAFISLFE